MSGRAPCASAVPVVRSKRTSSPPLRRSSKKQCILLEVLLEWLGGTAFVETSDAIASFYAFQNLPSLREYQSRLIKQTLAFESAREHCGASPQSYPPPKRQEKGHIFATSSPRTFNALLYINKDEYRPSARHSLELAFRDPLMILWASQPS